ncbi:MAG: exodeoxyribonuclease VII large subunit [Bacteroidaceae bacterium]|nr:exodeoxyribonuclease VII large subunit [Bacteroidaceae bacterium]
MFANYDHTRRPMTLYELNSLVRETLESSFPDTLWVQGELSEGRSGYGGHFYGELVEKDERTNAIVARARVNCWANRYRQLSQVFREATGETLRAGLTVMLEVAVTFHPQYGYSLNVVDIDPSYTLGDMARRRQQILRQLEADGILHDNQALALPMLVRRVAVVSSPTAAGYGDFCDQLIHNEYGFRFHIELFPATMQGNRVEESVTEALGRIAAEAELWDVAVIIRGGGATSDLSDFDSYPLAACVAQMPLPVITGIGHERDETVLDYVAHTHLKTPTAVAAFLIQHTADTAQHVDELGERLTRWVTERLAGERQRLARLSAVLPLSFRSMRERQERRLALIRQRLAAASRERAVREAHRIALTEERLRGLDPDLLLKRGYSMTLADGRLVRDASQVVLGQVIVTRLAHGEVTSVVSARQA